MRNRLATVVIALLATLALAGLARGEEQTRETYKGQVEPLCKANREANERIMAGVRDRVHAGKLAVAGRQFIRLSSSFGGLIGKLEQVPPPVGDEHRVDRWFDSLNLMRERVRTVGKDYKANEEIKANHELILVQRAGISANNTSIVFHFRYCKITRFEG